MELEEVKELLRKRAVGARLTEKQLEFFLRYAQERGTVSMSGTIKAMIEELMEYDDLHQVEYDFDKIKFINEKGEVESAKFREKFLKKREAADMEEIKLEKVKLPEVKKKKEKKNKEEEVFLI